MKSVLKYIISLLLFPLYAPGQDLIPPIRNYRTFEYNGASQNWGLDTNAEGELFVANSNGLLYFDGERWSLNKLPNNTIVRSVFCSGDRIYTGSYEEFGYWKKTDTGTLAYTSLTHLIKGHPFTNEDFWQILKFGDQIVFHSFSRAYSYKGDTIEIFNPRFTITGLAVHQDKLLVSSNTNGLFWLENGKTSPIADQEAVMGKTITEIVPTQMGLFIATTLHGCYILGQNGAIPWDNPLNEHLKHQQLNKILQLSDGRMAFGTIKNGVYLYDPKEDSFISINREAGLQNNTVLSITEFDRQLWLGLDSGIDRVQLDSPINYYKDHSGTVGTVYDMAVDGDRIYLGSNTGVYSVSDTGLSFIEGSQGHVWDLEILNGQLFCGHNSGTYKIQDGKFIPVSQVTGGYQIVKIPEQTGAFLQGTYTGLIKYILDASGESQATKVKGMDFPVKQLCFEDPRTVWLAHPYKGFYRAELNSGYDSVHSIRTYDETSLPSIYNIKVYNVKNQIIIKSGGKWYKYDPISDQIVPFELFGALAHKELVHYDNDRFWFIGSSPKDILYTDLKEDSLIVSAIDLQQRLVPDAQNIIKHDDSTYFITLSDGYGKLDLSKLQDNLKKSVPPIPVLRAFTGQTGAYSIKEDISLKFNDSQSITISVSSPAIIDPRYRYRLSGPKEYASHSDNGALTFYNLPYGDYTLDVSIVGMDNKSSDTLTLRFEIQPPWYLSKTLLALYFLGALGVALLIRAYNNKKLEKRHTLLKEKLHREQEAQFSKLEKEKLAKEVKLKQRELTSTTMNIARKNELILELKNMLLLHKDKFANQQRYRLFMKKLNQSIKDSDEWERFELNFKELHEDFFEILLERYPKLTPKDLKLCAYLKMNLASKEIAPLMGITNRGVEIHRYRLRKKLKIDNQQNLSNFLITLK